MQNPFLKIEPISGNEDLNGECFNDKKRKEIIINFEGNGALQVYKRPRIESSENQVKAL